MKSLEQLENYIEKCEINIRNGWELEPIIYIGQMRMLARACRRECSAKMEVLSQMLKRQKEQNSGQMKFFTGNGEAPEPSKLTVFDQLDSCVSEESRG